MSALVGKRKFRGITHSSARPERQSLGLLPLLLQLRTFKRCVSMGLVPDNHIADFGYTLSSNQFGNFDLFINFQCGKPAI